MLDNLGLVTIDDLKELGELADGLAISLIKETTKKLKSFKGKVGSEQVKENFRKKKQVLSRYMQSAPFTRLKDKLSFIFGVCLLVTTVFLLGNRSHDWYYIWHVLMVNSLVLYRFPMYYRLNWHYYMFDFCYFANAIFSFYLWYQPKSRRLYHISFMFSTGPLALAIGAFRNSLVFHSVDHLTSLTIHALPLVSAWNLRWFTIPY